MELSEFRNILAAILKVCIETEYSGMLSWQLAAGQMVWCADLGHICKCYFVCVCMYVRNKKKTDLGR